MKIEYPITFLYYKDLGKAVEFYHTVLGLNLAIDQGWCKIFSINGASYVGLVDESRGSLRAAEYKPVLLTLVVDSVEAWHEHLSSRDVIGITPVKYHPSLNITAFLCKDPEGYMIEIQKFHDTSHVGRV